VKIVDFGIAKAAHRTGQTEAGVIKGKYYYMSPEQAWGDPVDHRSDVFSLGIVLYELITGEMLYQEDNIPALLDRVRKADILPPSLRRPEVPTQLEEVVMKACAKKPEDRYQSAHEMSQALSTFLYTVSPSFSAQRLADFMGELFGEEQAKSGERAKPKPPPRASDDQTARLGAMRLVDFSPKVNSVIFDLDDEEGETRADVEPFVRSAQDETKELGQETDVEHPIVDDEEEDEETLIHDRVVEEHWEATTNRKDGTWDDPTSVDDAEKADPLVAPPRRIPKPPKGPRRPIPRATPPARPSARPPPPVPPRPTAAAKSARPPAPPPPKVSPPVAPPPARKPSFPKEPPNPRAEGQGAPWPPPAVEAPSQPAPAPAWPTPAPTPSPSAEPSAQTATAPAPSASPSAADQPTASIGAPDPFSARPDYVGETALLPRQRGALLLRIGLGVGAGLVIVALAILVVVLTNGETTAQASVEVISVPPGATVTLDGNQLPAATPLVISSGLDVGRTQRIEVELDGYETWTTTFRPIDGTLKQIAVLTPLRATLHVETDPTAHVWIDGVLFGSSPVDVPNREIGSEVHVRASLMGRDDVEQMVTITASDLNPSITLTLPDEEEEED
jgi:serine/threonine protein kinase